MDSQLQEVSEKLFHDVRLVDKEVMVGMADEFDASLGQLSSERVAIFGPLWNDSSLPMIARTGIWADESRCRSQRFGSISAAGEA